MRSALLLRAVVVGSGLLPSALAAQRLTASELGLGATVVMARRTFAGLELGLARRPGGQSRLAFVVAGGAQGGRAALRVQGTAQFVLTPAARSGIGWYAGLGSAFLGVRGAPGAGYLALVLGVEAAPGRGRRGGGAGGAGRAGGGGGVRCAAGWRWRRFPAWWW